MSYEYIWKLTNIFKRNNVNQIADQTWIEMYLLLHWKLDSNNTACSRASNRGMDWKENWLLCATNTSL